MSVEGLTPIVFEDMNGVQTLVDPVDVPIGNATAAQNVEFHMGTSVQSRGGRSNFLTLEGNVNIMSMAEYALQDAVTRRLLILDSGGSLWKELGDQTVQLIEAGLGVNTYAAMQTAFGRQYIAFSDGKLGTAPPRYYNDTNLYPVSQEGPGVDPNAGDGTPGGRVDEGWRFVRVMFELVDGYRTAPGPANKIRTAGGKTMRVWRIPMGPSNVARRIIIVSAAVSDDVIDSLTADGVRYFFIPDSNMVINDNTTVGTLPDPIVLDFSDAELTASEEVTDNLFRFVLPEQAGVSFYNSRLVWWGGRNEIVRIADNGILNAHFDGGFLAPTPFGSVPWGWTALFPGCNVASPVDGATGAVFEIIADGVSQRGTIRNDVQGGALNTIIQPGMAYGGLIRARRTPGLTAGSVSLYFLQSVSVVVGGAGGLTIPYDQLTTEWQTFSGLIYPPTATLPADLVLKLSGGKGSDGFTEVLAPAGEKIQVDYVGIYPLDQPYTPSLLYCSDPGQPGVYTDRGLISVSEDDGQAVRSCFTIRGSLYPAKENSLYVTTDNGDDPQNWSVQNVAGEFAVGTPSIQGVSLGEGWALLASRSGFYLFDGGFPQKISEEIQPTWDETNWGLGYALAVLVNAEQKQAWIQVPILPEFGPQPPEPPPPILPPPIPNFVSPTSGSPLGGTAIDIRGTGFQLGASVYVGGVICTSVAVLSDTEITAVTGAHPESGLVDVTVLNPDVQSGAFVGYEYAAAPYIASQTLGTPTNAYDLYLGFSIQTDTNTPTVFALGRWKTSGNTQTHNIYLYRFVDGAGGDVQIATVTVDTTLGADDAYQYIDLPTPITLLAGTGYYIISQEFSGGDMWYSDVDTTADSFASGVGTYGGSLYAVTLGSVGGGNPDPAILVPVNMKVA